MSDDVSIPASPTHSVTEVWSDGDEEEDQSRHRGRRSQRSLRPTHPAPTPRDSLPSLRPRTAESVTQSRSSRRAGLELSHSRGSGPSPKPSSSRGATSVWTAYRKEYEVDYGAGCLWIASRADRPRRVALVERCETSVARQKRALASQLSSRSFVRCLDVFESGPQTHLVLEPMAMSLVQIATALRFPCEQEVRAIVGQILEAFQAMALRDIVHGQVKLSTVLVNWQGEVKLMYPTTYSTAGDDRMLVMRDIQALGQVVCDLTKTPAGHDRRLASRAKGLYSDDLFDFVTATHRQGLDVLLQLPFLAREWHCSDLLALTWLAAGSSRVQYGQIVHSGAAGSTTEVSVDR